MKAPLRPFLPRKFQLAFPHLLGVRLLSTSLLLGWGAVALAQRAPEEVPAKYAALYATLQTDLNAYEASLDALLPAQKIPVAFATDLLVANGNRGADLLSATTMQGVNLSLDRFQQMGITAITFPIPYPLFDPSFPRRDEYMTFYESVAQAARAKGMKIDVECAVAFANTPFSPIAWVWSHYTVESLAEAKHAQLQIILDRVRPDYLNLGSETSTEAQLTGISALSDPATYAHFVQLQASGLLKGSTLVGAGCSAWESLATARLLAALPELDTFTFHVYPVDATSRLNSVAVSQIARDHGKRLVLDEAWLYKAPPGTGGVATSPEYFKRDAYSFFAPLDQQFLRCMAKLAQADGAEYVSAFWCNYFFAYLTYSDALDAMDYTQVAQQAAQAAGMAMVLGAKSSTGSFYSSLIAQYPKPLAASFSFSPSTATDAIPVTFIAAATGGTPPITYTWDFCGNGSAGASVTRKFAPGSCEVTLTATDSTGASATSKQEVQVGYSIQVTGAQWLLNPARMKVSGSGFEAGCLVKVNAVAVPRTVLKSPGLVIGKGSGLAAMVPKGTPVQVTVVAHDGRSSAPFPYAR